MQLHSMRSSGLAGIANIAFHILILLLADAPAVASGPGDAGPDTSTKGNFRPSRKESRVSPDRRNHAALPPAASNQTSNALSLGAPVFIENRGQFDERVKFRIAGNGANLWLTSEGIVFDFIRPKAAQSLRPSLKNEPAALRMKRSDPSFTSLLPETERIVFAQEFVGTNAGARIEARDPLPGIYNYFIGSDPAKWQTHVRAYREIVYHDVWQGIDLKLFSNGRNLEEELIVHAGADLKNARLAYEGIRGLTVAKDGSLKIRTDYGDMKETAPRLYQEVGRKRVPVGGEFNVSDGNTYAFVAGPHRKDADLVVDPTLLYSTFLGGTSAIGCGPFSCGNSEQANGIAVDSAGNAYVAGSTGALDFPTTVGAFQTKSSGSAAFVTKLNATGDQLVYSTYLGAVGPSAGAQGAGIALNAANEAYITGIAAQGSFPTTPNAFQTSCNFPASATYFLTKLNTAGDGLAYSTCFGFAGFANRATAIAVDSSGKAYITGVVGNLGSTPGTIPTTTGSFQPTIRGSANAFLSVFSPSLSGPVSLIYSTYLGGSISDTGQAVAVDSQGNAYIGGFTLSKDFPVTPGAFRTTYPGALVDLFVAKLNPSIAGPAALIYSTFLGGSTPGQEDFVGGIAVDQTGAAYVAGSAQTLDFPTTPGAFQTISRHPGKSNAFVTKLSPSGGNLVYSTLFGGASGGDGEFANAIALDSAGDAYITGTTNAPDLPITPDAFQPTFKGGGLIFFVGDAFITKFDSTGSKLIYSSYLGGHGADTGLGIAVDQIGDAYNTGYTGASDFPLLFPAQSKITPTTVNNPIAAFITKFAFGIQNQLSVSGSVPTNGGNTGNVTVTVFGGGFVPGTKVKLACPSQPELFASSITTTPDGRTFNATFNLIGVTPGQCLLTVSRPDGSSASAANPFTVEQGGAPDVWLEVMGSSAIRGGRPQTYYLNFGNQGNVDGGIVRLWISFPDFIDWSLPPDIVPASQGQSNGDNFIALDVNTNTGSSNVIPIKLTVPDIAALGHKVFQVQAWKEGR